MWTRTATVEALPARTANVLVEIAGRELEQEGMIKLPLNVQPIQSTDWQDALRALEDELFCNKPMSAEQWQTLHRIAAQQFERTTHADDLPPLYPAS